MNDSLNARMNDMHARRLNVTYLLRKAQ
jgi:hypothetical protein